MHWGEWVTRSRSRDGLRMTEFDNLARGRLIYVGMYDCVKGACRRRRHTPTLPPSKPTLPSHMIFVHTRPIEREWQKTIAVVVQIKVDC